LLSSESLPFHFYFEELSYPLPVLGGFKPLGAINTTRNGLLQHIGATETTAKGAKPSQIFFYTFLQK